MQHREACCTSNVCCTSPCQGDRINWGSLVRDKGVNPTTESVLGHYDGPRAESHTSHSHSPRQFDVGSRIKKQKLTNQMRQCGNLGISKGRQ